MGKRSVSRRKATSKSPLVLGLGPANDPDRYLGQALSELADKLFAAEAIIAAVSDSIEEQFGEEIDRAGSKVPCYPRALREAIRLIASAYVGLEMPPLRARAVTLAVKDRGDQAISDGLERARNLIRQTMETTGGAS